jgi:hypothetical protein
MAAENVWLARYDGSDMVKADQVGGISRDYNGNIVVHMSGARGATVTLVAPGPHGGPHTPEDFHRRLLRLVTGMGDTKEPILVRPVSDEANGWQWITEPL